MATRVGSASALNRAASSSRSVPVRGSVSGPQQIAGRTAIDFIDILQYNSAGRISKNFDERRPHGRVLRLPAGLLSGRLLRLLLDVEADVQHVPVLNLV